MTITGMYSTLGMPNFDGSPVGNVYFVGRNTASTQFNMWSRRFGKTRYADGSWCFHSDPADGTGIQEAITGSTGSFNNYLFVAPGTYTTTTGISHAGKSGIHMLAVNGGNMDVGCTTSVYLFCSGNYPVLTTAANTEIAGFALKNKAGYAAITVPAGIFSNDIHNNYFMMVLGSAVNIVDATASEANKMGRVHHNRFYTEVTGNATSAISLAAGYAKDACHNIITLGGVGTLDYGINNQSEGGDTSYNIVSEGPGTITNAIYIGNNGSAVGNSCAVVTGRGLAGGTAERSFVNNRDGASGGATPIQT
jgi:hypothetical protein